MSYYNSISEELDLKAESLPSLKFWKTADISPPYRYPAELGDPFISSIEKILKLLQVKDIHKYHWHEYCSNISFKPYESPYFRNPQIDKNLEVLFQGQFKLDYNLEAVIGVGFDEKLDYESDETIPELLSWFRNIEEGDIEIYPPTQWRNVLSEIFDLDKINPSTTLDDF